MAILNHGSTLRTADGGQTTTTIVTAANIGTYGVATNSTYYVGTTQNVFNRASGAQTLTGVSIDGNAATVTNGVYTTGAQTIGGTKTFSDVLTFNANVDMGTSTGSKLPGHFYTNTYDGTNVYFHIGTSSSTNKILNLRVFDSANNYATYIFNSAGTVSAPGDFRAPIFYDSNDTAYYLDPASNSRLLNLGLGNVTPDLRLSVSGDAQLSGILYLGGTAGSYNSWGSRTYTTSGVLYNNSSSVEFNNYGYGSTWTFTLGGGNATSSGAFRAPVFYDSDNTAYYLDAANSGTSLLVAGKVGIGTTSPSAKLEIAGFSTGAGLKLNYGNSSGTIEAVNFIANGASNGVIGMQMVSAGVGDLWLGGSGGRILTLYRDGNVGIGTTSPSLISGYVGLNVVNAGYTQIKLQSSASSAGIEFKPSSGNNWELQANTSSQWFVFDRTQDVYRLLINSSGNVGIGTASPSQKLDVSGAINASTYVYAGVFYDNDNTVYYTNPSGTSNLVGLTVANTITGSVSGSSASCTGNAATATNGLTTSNYVSYSAFTGSVTSTYGNFTTPGLIIGDAQYGFYVVSGNVYYKSASGGVHYWRNTANSGNTMSLDNSGNLNVSGYLQTTGNLIYPSTYGVTQRLEVSNAANNAWIDGLTIAPGGIVTAYGDSRAPIFYDSANTAYYCDPNGVSNLYGVAIRGDVASANTDNQIFFWGTGNSTTSAIGFKSNSGVFPNPTGNGDGYNTYLTMDTDGRGWVFRRGVGGTDFTSAYTAGWILNNGIWQANASMRAPIFYDSNDTAYYGDFASTSVLNKLNYQQLRRNFASTVYTGTTGSRTVKTFSGVLVGGSAIAGNSAYTVIETTIPQGAYQMGGFTIKWFENYSSTNAKTSIEIAGYWNPVSNGGFIGFEYTTSNPNVQPTIRVGANASGNTVFILDHFSSAYTVIIARDLWLGYDNTDGEWGTGWTMVNTTTIAAYSNIVSAVLRVGPTLTGTGASGSWGISVTGSSASCTGNAATATNGLTTSNYVSYSAFTASLTSTVDARAPIFYDSNDTNYYVDPASTSILNGTRHNTVVAGSTSAMTSAGQLAIYSSANPYISFHDGGVGRTAYMQETGGRFYFGEVTYTESEGSFRAPLFYDSNDTAYYLDPRSASVLSGLKLNGIDNDAAGNTSDAILWINKPNNNDWGIRVTGNLEYLLKLEGATSHSYNIQGLANGSEFWRCGTDLLYHNSNIRAPIFYDSNDTTYYLNPADVSYLYEPRMAYRTLIGAQSYDTTLFETPVTTRPGVVVRGIYPHIEMVAAGINNVTHGATLRFVAYDTANATTGDFKHWVIGCGGTNATGLYFGYSPNQTNPHYGIGRGWSTGNDVSIFWILNDREVYAENGVRATIFYDRNDTAYYVDPSSNSILLDVEARGGINLRRDLSAATGISFYNTSYYNWQVYMAPAAATGCGANGNLTAPNGLTNVSSWALRSRMENVGSYGWLWELGGSGGGGPTATSLMELDTGGILTLSGQVRAPIFYDRDNTAYYLDPNSTTSLRTVGSWRSDSSTWDGEFSGKIQYHSNHWYFQSGDLWIFRNSGGTNVATINQSGVISAAFSGSLTGNVTGNVTGTAINIAGNGAGYDTYGTIGVTEPAGASNYSYYGLTRQSNIGCGFGLTGTTGALGLGANAFWFGSATSTAAGVMGSAYIAFNGSNLVAVGTADATQFRDKDNTAYYLDPASTSNLYYIVMPHIGNGSPNLVVNNGASENWNAIKINGGNDNNGIGFSNTSHSAFARNNLSFHTHNLDSIRFHSSGWDTLFEVAGSSGNAWLKGGSFDSSFTRLVNPGGAYYVTGTSTITGAIKIRLPRLNANTMMRMTVKIYQYNTGQSATIECGGYDYSGDGVWRNIFAYQNSDLFATVNVRFGNDGTYDCVWIGETSSTWSYPQVFVTDFQAGYSNYTSDWGTGWNISYVTAFNTVTDTRVAYKTLNASNYNSYSPTLTGTGASGTWSINVTGNASGTAASISGFNNPTTAATANTIVYRDGSGHITGNYILGGYFNSSAGNSENPTIGQIWTQSTGDNYLRKSTPAHFRSQVTDGSYPSLTGANASGTWSINVTGNAGGSSASCTGNSATTTLATKATRANGNFYIDDNYGNTVVGVYTSTRYQGVYAMGDSYKLAADGTTTGTLYGIAWSHQNAGGAAANLASHGLLILENGVFKGAWGGGSLRTPGDVRGTLFYDWDNTGYYCDPASTSNLNAITAAGNITAAQYYTGGWFRNNASGNGLYNEATGQHFYSDSANYWNVASSASTQGIRFRTGGHAGTVRGYIIADTNNDVGLLNQDGNWRVRVVGGDYTIFDGSSIRAQIFYDSNDTGYYTDPAGTSILNVVRANSYVQKSASQSLSGTVGCTIDVAAAGIHVLTLAASTTISSFTYNYRAPNPSVNTIMLVIKYGGTASITWTNVLWANGVTPTITGVSGYADVYMLTSYQGTTGVWIGTVVSQGVVSTSL